MLRYQWTTLRELARWPEAAAVLRAFLEWLDTLQTTLPDNQPLDETPWAEETTAFFRLMHSLESSERTVLLEALGDETELVQKLFGW